MTIARSPHPLAGKTVTLRVKNPQADPDALDGKPYRVEDWWENVAGMSWMFAQGNPACLKYAVRAAFSDLPTDDEVLYGKVGALGHLIHISELGDEVPS